MSYYVLETILYYVNYINLIIIKYEYIILSNLKKYTCFVDETISSPTSLIYILIKTKL